MLVRAVIFNCIWNKFIVKFHHSSMFESCPISTHLFYSTIIVLVKWMKTPTSTFVGLYQNLLRIHQKQVLFSRFQYAWNYRAIFNNKYLCKVKSVNFSVSKISLKPQGIAVGSLCDWRQESRVVVSTNYVIFVLESHEQVLHNNITVRC